MAGEVWQPNQRGTTEAGGSYVLEIAYSDDRELLGDILRYGSDVQGLWSCALRSKMPKAFLEAAAKYV